MKRLIAAILLIVSASSCNLVHSVLDKEHTVEVAKPRMHKSWPKSHRWRKKINIWKFSFQMPERGGVKKVKMRS